MTSAFNRCATFGLVAAVLLCLGGDAVSGGTEVVVRWSPDDIAANWKRARTYVDVVNKEAANIESGLLSIVRNEEVPHNQRMIAVRDLATLAGSEALAWCSAHVSVHHAGYSHRDSPHAALTAQYVLRKSGWQAVPHVLHALEQGGLDQRSIGLLTDVLWSTCGRGPAIALVQEVASRATFDSRAKGCLEVALSELRRERQLPPAPPRPPRSE